MTTAKTTTKDAAESSERTTATRKRKTATKTATKKTATAKKEKLDLATFAVTQAELASILGLATSNITPMVQNGMMVKDEDGKFNLRDSVSGYCKRMREKRSGDSKSELELEQVFLKNEKLKTQLQSWRMQRDREVGLAIIQGIVTTMTKLKESCRLVPKLPEEIDEFIRVVQDIDLEKISYLIEGETEDDDE